MKSLRFMLWLIVVIWSFNVVGDSKVLSDINTEDFYLSQHQRANFNNNPFVKDIKEINLSSLKLLGIVYSENDSAALINRQIVRIDDYIAKAKVVSIKPDLVVLSNDSGIYKLGFEGQ